MKLSSTKVKIFLGISFIVLIFIVTLLNSTNTPLFFGIRSEFLLFGLTLLGVALLHDFTLEVSLTGLVSIIGIKLLFLPEFNLISHLHHEQSILINLFGLLIGFAILSNHFEKSHIPEKIPKYLPKKWLGGFVLLLAVFILSSFLDNIAGAMIGGAMASAVYNKNLHLGYIVAIVAASNAGGSGSVIGDTTTTMIWINGAEWHSVLHAYYAAFSALLIFGIIGSIQQEKLQTLNNAVDDTIKIKWEKVFVVILILIGAIIANYAYDFPAIGVWIAIFIGALITKTPWDEIPKSLKGTLFLLALVLSASMMPVNQLPSPSVYTAFGLGFLSSIFDNIPLTKLAIDQNGYDWGVLAFSVGFGGSMIWFGSSAGVAISNLFPQAKSVGNWLKSGWHVIVAYIVGFIVMVAISGWNPKELKKKNEPSIKTKTELHIIEDKK